jgi:TonB family protein
MPGLLMLGVALALSPAPGDKSLRAYPAMQQGGATYAVTMDKTNRIGTCLPLDPKANGEVVKAACAALAEKGVPETVTPAIAKGTPDDWFPSAEYPAEAIPAHSSATVTLIYEIDAQGMAANCMIYRSSGVQAFDVAACAALVKRARFTPASYKGKPVHAAAISSFGYESL